MKPLFRALIGLLLISPGALSMFAATSAAPKWHVGKPIITYWAGPPMTDAAARQMAEGGWNVVWCAETELDVAHRHGLRAQLMDGLLTPASLDHPEQRTKLDALIARVRTHPALYNYFVTDEPGATNFPALGRLVAYLRERDPAHLTYINLFPTYASNEQLGTQGDTVTAYREHLRQFVEVVKPELISYDHYQFLVTGDLPDYFLNLAMIRRAALDARVPFLNIVQACSWATNVRVPTEDEMRYLVYTTLAYGAQGISYYVYLAAGHTRSIANADGSPSPIYQPLKQLNRDFLAVASQLQPLRSLGVYHTGMLPPGAEPLPNKAAFRLDPPIPTAEFKTNAPVQGVLIGCFGPAGQTIEPAKATHWVLVNLDYKSDTVVGLRGPRRLEVFDAETGKWSTLKAGRVEVALPRGGGKLFRVKR